MHFNTRFIVYTKKLVWWWNGCNPLYQLIIKKKNYFHNELKKMCNLHNKKYYPKYKKWCDKYFYLPHRKEARGIGGIFFDYKMDELGKRFFILLKM